MRVLVIPNTLSSEGVLDGELTDCDLSLPSRCRLPFFFLGGRAFPTAHPFLFSCHKITENVV